MKRRDFLHAAAAALALPAVTRWLPTPVPPPPPPMAIIGAADLYISDFGTIAVIPNRFLREKDAWYLSEEWLVAQQIEWVKKSAAPEGDPGAAVKVGYFEVTSR